MPRLSKSNLFKINKTKKIYITVHYNNIVTLYKQTYAVGILYVSIGIKCYFMSIIIVTTYDQRLEYTT